MGEYIHTQTQCLLHTVYIHTDSGASFPGCVFDAPSADSKVHIQVLPAPTGEVVRHRIPPAQPSQTVTAQGANVTIGQCIEEALEWV